MHICDILCLKTFRVARGGEEGEAFESHPWLRPRIVECRYGRWKTIKMMKIYKNRVQHVSNIKHTFLTFTVQVYLNLL